MAAELAAVSPQSGAFALAANGKDVVIILGGSKMLRAPFADALAAPAAVGVRGAPCVWHDWRKGILWD